MGNVGARNAEEAKIILKELRIPLIAEAVSYTHLEDELDIYVGNIRKFTALPGSSGDKYAVRVTSVIREEQ